MKFHRSPLVSILILFLGFCSQAADKPNIVYILADDLGYGDLGCYNKASKIPTPNLDQLAKEGMRFTDAHAPTSVCTPTRYALLTGRYSWRSRLKMGVLGPWDPTLIEAGRLTVPAMLREQGYATACFGKWHLGFKWPTKDGQPAKSGPDKLSNVDFTKPLGEGPITRGFDYYFGVDLPNYPPYCFIENDHTVGIPTEPSDSVYNRPGPVVKGWKLVEILPEITRRALKYVDDAAKAPTRKPFFLYFPLTAPHYPVVPSPEFHGKSQASEYGDFVTQVDWTVGQVLEALKRNGLTENTLVFFTSDNGPEVVEIKPGAYARAEQYDHFSMGELRGVKRDAWEGGHRVPFLARWPGKIKAGSVSDETICHVDLMGTVAALLDVKVPRDAGEDSYNLLPVFMGQNYTKPIREATVHHGAKGRFAIRKGDWVLIDGSTGDENAARGETEWFKKQRGYTDDKQEKQLFDLKKDISERKNLYAENPEKANELKTLLEKYKTEGRSRP